MKLLVALAVCGMLAASAQAGMVELNKVTGEWEWDAVAGCYHRTVTTTMGFYSDANDVWVMERPITYRTPLIRSAPLVKPDDFDVSDASRYHPAVEITPHREWLQALPVSDFARWISVNERGSDPNVDTNSGLYAIMLYNNELVDDRGWDVTIAGVNVDLYFTADNFLGGNGMSALYFNGDAVTEGDNGLWGNFETAAVQLFKNQYDLHFSVDLTPGENWLYLDATSFFGPAGVIFYGEFTYSQVESYIPEPMSMSLLVVGAMGMLIRRKR